ncbi:MAG: hypothetical protein M5U09_18070 [Gammaproteobacteria bacterium]|nr:hypothetical protein [Gammaproteobacteria bacterium]
MGHETAWITSLVSQRALGMSQVVGSRRGVQQSQYLRDFVAAFVVSPLAELVEQHLDIGRRIPGQLGQQVVGGIAAAPGPEAVDGGYR